MRVIVCLLVAAFVGCCTASDVENKLLDELETLEAVVKGMDKNELPDDVQAVLAMIPGRLRSRVAAYIPKQGRNKKRFLKCARAVGSMKEPEELDNAAKRAPKAVEEAVLKLPADYRNALINYDNAMRKIIDVMIVCTKPKLSKKRRGGKGKGKKTSILEYRKQANATAEILMSVAHAPANVAWKLLLYATSIPAADRVEMLNCGKKAHAELTAHLTKAVAEPDSAAVMEAVGKLPAAAQTAIIGYGTGLFYIVNNMLECTTAGR